MNKAYTNAISLLAKREYGEQELFDKLTRKGFLETDIIEAIAACKRQGLQSDLRFAESVIRARVRQGYGPLRIRQELESKRIASEVIEAALDELSFDWLALGIEVKKKKYKAQGLVSFAELQKQKRFLLYRGFPSDVIAQVFQHDEEVVDDEKF